MNMSKMEMVRLALQSGERYGLVRYREHPTVSEVRSHYFNLSLYASVFLSPFILG